jgi:hypothetical protein
VANASFFKELKKGLHIARDLPSKAVAELHREVDRVADNPAKEMLRLGAAPVLVPLKTAEVVQGIAKENHIKPIAEILKPAQQAGEATEKVIAETDKGLHKTGNLVWHHPVESLMVVGAVVVSVESFGAGTPTIYYSLGALGGGGAVLFSSDPNPSPSLPATSSAYDLNPKVCEPGALAGRSPANNDLAKEFSHETAAHTYAKAWELLLEHAGYPQVAARVGGAAFGYGLLSPSDLAFSAAVEKPGTLEYQQIQWFRDEASRCHTLGKLSKLAESKQASIQYSLDGKIAHLQAKDVATREIEENNDHANPIVREARAAYDVEAQSVECLQAELGHAERLAKGLKAWTQEACANAKQTPSATLKATE